MKIIILLLFICSLAKASDTVYYDINVDSSKFATTYDNSLKLNRADSASEAKKVLTYTQLVDYLSNQFVIDYILNLVARDSLVSSGYAADIASQYGIALKVQSSTASQYRAIFLSNGTDTVIIKGDGSLILPTGAIIKIGTDTAATKAQVALKQPLLTGGVANYIPVYSGAANITNSLNFKKNADSSYTVSHFGIGNSTTIKGFALSNAKPATVSNTVENSANYELESNAYLTSGSSDNYKWRIAATSISGSTTYGNLNFKISKNSAAETTPLYIQTSGTIVSSYNISGTNMQFIDNTSSATFSASYGFKAVQNTAATSTYRSRPSPGYLFTSTGYRNASNIRTHNTAIYSSPVANTDSVKLLFMYSTDGSTTYADTAMELITKYGSTTSNILNVKGKVLVSTTTNDSALNTVSIHVTGGARIDKNLTVGGKEVKKYNDGYAEMYSYDNASACNIDATNVYHAVFSGIGNNDATLAPTNDAATATYKAGARLTIASVATYNAGTQIQITITAGHSLLAGEPVVITGSTNYDGTYLVDAAGLTATQFVVTKAYVATNTGFATKPATLKILVAGVYAVTFNASGTSANNNDEFKWEMNKDITALDNISARQDWIGSSVYRSASGSGLMSVTANQYVWLSVKNYSGTGDLTMNNININLTRH